MDLKAIIFVIVVVAIIGFIVWRNLPRKHPKVKRRSGTDSKKSA